MTELQELKQVCLHLQLVGDHIEVAVSSMRQCMWPHVVISELPRSTVLVMGERSVAMAKWSNGQTRVSE